MKLSYDLHLHSCLSPCGDDEMTPNNLVNMAALLGLDMIAVSDHNTAGQLPAVFAVAESCGICVVPALEACTAEEIHFLCLADNLLGMLAFSDALYQYLPPFPNDPTVFGNQLLMNEEDEVVGTEPRFLANALTLGMDRLLRVAKEYDVLVIPAHADKASYSVYSSLGCLPADYGFTCVELKNPASFPEFTGHRIFNSDAHALETMQEPTNFIELPEKSARALVQRLRQEKESHS